MKYKVTIDYKRRPKFTNTPSFACGVQAQTEQEAKRLAIQRAKSFGWTEKVTKVTVREEG